MKIVLFLLKNIPISIFIASVDRQIDIKENNKEAININKSYAPINLRKRK